MSMLDRLFSRGSNHTPCSMGQTPTIREWLGKAVTWIKTHKTETILIIGLVAATALSGGIFGLAAVGVLSLALAIKISVTLIAGSYLLGLPSIIYRCFENQKTEDVPQLPEANDPEDSIDDEKPWLLFPLDTPITSHNGAMATLREYGKIEAPTSDEIKGFEKTMDHLCGWQAEFEEEN